MSHAGEAAHGGSYRHCPACFSTHDGERYVPSMSPLGFIGGTGPQGLGLALRFAAAGEAVMIGSRVAERAHAAAARIRERVPGVRATGHPNGEVLAGSDRIL